MGRSNDGKDQQVFHLEYKQTPPHVMITFLKPKLKEFVVHNFEAKWQDNMFKICLQNLSFNQFLSVVDYAENYSFQWQNGIQS